MDFDFYKIQTAGNDLILVNFSGKPFPESEALREIARMVCRRDYGIGGNGFIAVKELSRNKIEAFFLDPTGSFSDTTTDAAICFSRFIFDSGSAGKEDFNLKMNKNEHAVGIIDSYNFRLSMGYPLTVAGEKYIEHPDSEYINNIRSEGKDFPVTELYLQKNGVVVFSENRGLDQLKKVSMDIFKSAGLSSDFRLIFATVNSRADMEVQIRNSRGDDFASSCAIAAAASVVNGFLDRNATIYHKKGEYYFQWLQPSNEIFITGSSDYVYTGSFFIDD